MNSISQKVLAFSRKAFRRHLGRGTDDEEIAKLYKGKDYLDGYIAHTNVRVASNPKDAVGGMWEEIGSLQFDFLKKMGMQPKHRLLDIGCGTLRGGRHFIRYLDTAHYTGIDISPACLEAGHKLLNKEKLTSKRPRLILNTSKRMNFSEFDGETFDFILAQSVFTHLPEILVRECFENIGRCMHNNSEFYFTYTAAESKKRNGIKDFAYPWSFFKELAADCEFSAAEISDKYPHPRGQKMGRVKRP